MSKAQKDIVKSEKQFIITPGGRRLESQVHLIEPECYVSGAGGRFKKILAKTNVVLEDFGKISTKERLQVFENKKNEYKKENLPVTDQWIVNSGWLNVAENPINYFSTKWIVPNVPETNHGQLIYLFNGIQQTETGPFILQPVLQWGVSPAGGGNYWAIANWYVGGENEVAFHGPLIPVDIGNSIEGIMILTEQSETSYSYLSSFSGHPVANLSIKDIDQLAWANETLECYGINEFSDYPNNNLTAMTNINIKVGNTQATIKWNSENRVTDNGQQCLIVSNDSINGQVDLYYRS